jgi:transcriptional regulator with XRE-family HTH domain
MPTDIRDRIQAERTRLGLSRAETAARLGMLRETYTQLETKTLDPRLSTLVGLVGLGMRASAIVPELTRTKN